MHTSWSAVEKGFENLIFCNVRSEILPFVFVTILCSAAKRASLQHWFVKCALWSCPLHLPARQSRNWKKSLVLLAFRQIKGRKGFLEELQAKEQKLLPVLTTWWTPIDEGFPGEATERTERIHSKSSLSHPVKVG